MHGTNICFIILLPFSRIKLAWLSEVPMVVAAGEKNVTLTRETYPEVAPFLRGYLSRQTDDSPVRVPIYLPPLEALLQDSEARADSIIGVMKAFEGYEVAFELLASIFPVAAGLRIPGRRGRRFVVTATIAIGGAIAALAGLTGWGIHDRGKLWEKIDEVSGKMEAYKSETDKMFAETGEHINHLRESSVEQAKALQMLGEAHQAMNARLDQIQDAAIINDFSLRATLSTSTCLDSSRVIGHIFADVQKGTLNPNAVSSRDLAIAFQYLLKEASAQGMALSISNPWEILSAPTAYAMKDGKLILLSFISAYNPDNMYHLFRYKPFPFLTQSKQFAYFEASTHLLGQSFLGDKYKAIDTQSLMMDCENSGDMYYCPREIPAVPRPALDEADFATRCLSTMYLGKVDDVMAACSMESMPPFNKMIQLNPTKYFLASKKRQRITVICGERKQEKTVEDIVMLDLISPNCDIVTDTYKVDGTMFDTTVDVPPSGWANWNVIQLENVLENLKNGLSAILKGGDETSRKLVKHMTDLAEKTHQKFQEKFVYSPPNTPRVVQTGQLTNMLWDMVGLSTWDIVKYVLIGVGGLIFLLFTCFYVRKCAENFHFNGAIMGARGFRRFGRAGGEADNASVMTAFTNM